MKTFLNNAFILEVTNFKLYNTDYECPDKKKHNKINLKMSEFWIEEIKKFSLSLRSCLFIIIVNIFAKHEHLSTYVDNSIYSIILFYNSIYKLIYKI